MTGSEALEACNGADDDCDGIADDPISAQWVESCTLQGVCAEAATYGATCDGSGLWQCPWEMLSSWEEEESLCDGFDNDCDGDTDEPVECAD